MLVVIPAGLVKLCAVLIVNIVLLVLVVEIGYLVCDLLLIGEYFD